MSHKEQAPGKETTAKTPKKILIADDEVDIAKILQVVFEKEGYQVKVVDNGKKALEEISKEHPDLVISDILMPILNGFKLCEAIKSDNKLSHIPVVLLTAVYRQEHHIEMGFKH